MSLVLRRSPAQHARSAGYSKSSRTLPDSSGGLAEADADIEWAGAVASNATIIYVYAKDVRDAARQVIDQNLAPILNLSYRTCESNLSA